jgi:diguanylate cyclase (GGDEF)-like protein
MNLSYALNTFSGPAIIIIIIFAECTVKFSNERKIKRIFCAILAAVFLFLTADFIYSFHSFNQSAGNYIMYRIIWPVIAAILLFIYLFIILKENKIDYLTGLDNRYSFFEFAHKLSRNKHSESWVIAMIDINNFRSINEVYGHLEGDNAVRNIAKIIRKCIKKTDFAARYGGDEFVLVLKTEISIETLLDRINGELEKYNETSEKLYKIEITYGYDTYITNDRRQLVNFIGHINTLMHTNTEEKRRVGDFKI